MLGISNIDKCFNENLPGVLNLHKGVYVLCFLLSLVFTGCVTMPPGTGLKHAVPVANTLDKKVWLKKVAISDPSIDEKSVLEGSFTMNISEYMKEGAYFRDVNLLPGSPGENDLILHFQFDRYQLKRAPHPAYFPLSFLTLTMYIWFGGPIFTDSSDLSGKLIIEDSNGLKLAEVSSKIEDSHSVSLWSPEYALPSGIKDRTAIIEDLLRKAIKNP